MKRMLAMSMVLVLSAIAPMCAEEGATPAPTPAPAPAVEPSMPPPSATDSGANTGAENVTPLPPTTNPAGVPAPNTANTPAPTTTASALPKNQEPPPTLMGQLSSMLPILLIVGFFFYFMLIRPEQKRRKEQENMLNTIKKGSNVLTFSGIFGVIQDVQGDSVLVAIDQAGKVIVKMQKSHIQSVLGAGATPTAADTK